MKKTIALVTGGYSGESAISYKSAVTIYNNLDKNRFEVYTIDVNKNGWIYCGEEGTVAIDKNDFSLTFKDKKILFDAVFLGMHGTPGEDGRLQGYFDMMGLPYTSCNAAASALTFNKKHTTAVAAMAGIPVAKSMHLLKHTPYVIADILAGLRLPYFIKPNNGGSSIGMSKVTREEQLAPALDKAFREDNQVLVEEMINGREFTVGVYKTGSTIAVLPITEIVAHNEFFDFEAKYEGKSSETTPAQLTHEWKAALESMAAKAYEVFDCAGVVRIDFIYNEEANAPYMLEINTIPGQSEASVIPQQVAAQGGTLKDFYAALIDECLRTHVKSF